MLKKKLHLNKNKKKYQNIKEYNKIKINIKNFKKRK